MAKVTELTAGLARPIAEENGCTLWDVEYVKEAGTWFLRVYIDKEGGVDINDCEAVSRRLSDALDEADRTLKKPEHFAAFLGSEVDVKLYRPLEGRKEHTGVLRAYDAESGAVTVETAAGERTFPKKDVAQVRLAVRF